jgi:two-component system response regulator FixJ
MPTSHPRTVFVVDDDEVVRDSLSALLQSRHYTVLEFASGRDFLTRAAGVMPGCLVVDVHMPEMTGLELLKILRARGNPIATVVITGRKDPSIAAQAKELGAVAILDKPVSHAVLFSAIETALAA